MITLVMLAVCYIQALLESKGALKRQISSLNDLVVVATITL